MARKARRKQPTEKESRAITTMSALNNMAIKLDKSLRTNDANKSAQLIGILQGMKDLAKKTGTHCGCSTVQLKGGRLPHTQCICAESAAALRAREKRAQSRIPGALTLYTFAGLGASKDGVRCRNGQGSFVPVSQCKGPVGRDPETGQYVSIKDL